MDPYQKTMDGDCVNIEHRTLNSTVLVDNANPIYCVKQALRNQEYDCECQSGFVNYKNQCILKGKLPEPIQECPENAITLRKLKNFKL